MVCPFLELLDSRCSEHFRVNNLADAFSHCFGRHQGCPIYARLIEDPVAVAMTDEPIPPRRPNRLAG